jgi:demethylmenaquinone methyltransferase/2-methoxy-6-polyprenyl-1,4-benzoquinol methylase
LHFVIPTLGRLISGERDAYKYLPDTTENFVTAEKMSVLMAAVGFKKVGFERLMFGTIAIHWAEK